ncbi:ribonuclease P protein component [Marinithermofilum abyssi]|uniref:Ribonuclease P protein component n=1 Tax=Marinithermofilum abyssi TaxID=1571185 RepID=A0A8J2YA52_9BACL|nr:ribonuclease P protein component [Marinithermofilum abyssi]GGE06137.1 ribonuclease P protein component [Marinithermofilum abyssi]
MQKQYRLKRRNDFRRAFRTGSSAANRQFVVYRSPRREKGPVRVGISVSRKVGNAVTRNRIKRLVKEVVRQWVDDLPANTDLIIIARNPAAEMDYHQIQSSLRHVFHRAQLLPKQKRPSAKEGRNG